MKFRFLCVLCVLCGLESFAVAIDREAFTFTKYDLEIRLEPEQKRLGARGKIILRNDSAQPQKIAVLQISSSLSWRSIKADGKAVQYVTQPYVSDIDHTGGLSEAVVTLPVELKPKDSVELEIGYEGTILQDATRLTQIGVPDDIAGHTSWDQIGAAFTAVRGAGYVAWYPIATEAADFSEGNSLFQVADRWRARAAESAMTITLCSSENPSRTILMGDLGRGVHGGAMAAMVHPATSTTCIRHDFDPVGTPTPTFVQADFKRAVADPSSNASIYYLTGHQAGADTYSRVIEPAAKFVSEWFGPPTTSIAIADMADSKAAPFESGTLLLTSLARVDAKLASVNLVHEFVHASFSSPHPWISEGLAHFAEAVYREQKQDGREAALDFLNRHRAVFVDAEKDVAATPQTNPGQPLATTFDESYYRSKAVYVWWMLRDMIGEDALKQVIHNYRSADDNDKNPKYVEHMVNAAAKSDLSWFFDDWVDHDRGLPDFRVLAAHPWTGAKDVKLLAVTIENLGGAGAEVPFTIRFATGEISRRIEVRAKSTATIRVEVPGTATEVVVNDGSVPESDLTNNVFKIAEK